MTGRLVSMPECKHRCAPGWREELSDGPPFGPGIYAIPPSAYDYPKGTVWECECGAAWVSRGSVPRGGYAGPGMIEFRPEHWRERRKRTKTAGHGKTRTAASP